MDKVEGQVRGMVVMVVLAAVAAEQIRLIKLVELVTLRLHHQVRVIAVGMVLLPFLITAAEVVAAQTQPLGRDQAEHLHLVAMVAMVHLHLLQEHL
jgi:uncharacterized membrane protein